MTTRTNNPVFVMLPNPLTKTVFAGLAFLCFSSALAAQPADTSQASLDMLDEYCVTCHNLDDYAGSLDLSLLLSEGIPQHAETWEKVIRKLRAGMMPPPSEPRPQSPQYLALTQWLETEIDNAAPLQPGTKTLHRLNRNEYANAIRDLLGLDIDPALFLPQDTLARGFDNMAGSLTLSPTLLEAYATAAINIARTAIGYLNSPTEATYIPNGDTSQNQHLEGMPFGTRGGMKVSHTFPADGEYNFMIKNHRVGTFIPGEQLELSIDGERLHLWEYSNLGRGRGEGGEGDLSVVIPVTAGTHMVGVTFIATQYRPSFGVIKQYDRISLENEMLPGLYNHPVIGLFKIQGPFNATPPTDSPSMRRVFICKPLELAEEQACARNILSNLARQAYRRPVTEADLEPLMAFYQQGRDTGNFQEGIELGLARILTSPQFLVRAEQEPPGLNPGETYPISDMELASRMSFFLWSSLPDEELIALASRNQLGEPEVLEQQVMRMLQDPRANALVENFASQWFYLRNLPATFPDGIFYPDWDDELRQGFRRETELLFGNIIREDNSILDLLDADYTFVNERLAKHYGIPNIYGSHFRKVALGPELDYRRGLLGQGSFLSITFTQNFRTSPVKRGVWVLENILGTPPPAPPANVPALENTGESQIRSLREQMTLHRQDPVCASCHKIMDGIGFALENFDADGQWRDAESHPRKWGGIANPIDTSVQLWDGSSINGAVELRNTLLKYSPQFARFAVEKLMTYGLGRGVEYFDMPAIRAIVNNAEAQDYRFSALVLGIVNSAPFRMRTKLDDDAELATLADNTNQ